MAALHLQPADGPGLRPAAALPPMAAQRRRAGARRTAVADSDVFVTRVPPTRVMRVAAAFYRSREDAQAMRRLLRRHQGLARAQVLLLAPADRDGPRFAELRSQWDARRPQRPMPPGALPPAKAMAVGLLTGLAVAVLWRLAVQATWADGVAVGTVAMLAGATLALVWALVRTPQPAPRRFDLALQKRLAQGLHAVVVQGVAERDAVDVIDALQASGVCWCAEAPLKSASAQ